MPTTEQNEQKKITAFQAPDGELTGKELFLSEWFLKHKLLLGRIGTIVLGVIAFGLLGFSSWKWGEYLIIGYDEDRRLVEEQVALFQNYEALQPLYAAQDITVSPPAVFRSAPGKYDFIAAVVNPNEQHVVLLQYQFIFPGWETSVAETTILPGERRPIALFGVEIPSTPTNVRLSLISEKYRRIDSHLIPNARAFAEERIKFRGDRVQFFERFLGDGASVPRVTFDLSNDSAYSYWQPAFYIELLSGGNTIGAASLILDRFLSGEKRAIDLRLFGDVRGVTDIRLSPVVNVFDPSVYMAPGE